MKTAQHQGARERTIHLAPIAGAVCLLVGTAGAATLSSQAPRQPSASTEVARTVTLDELESEPGKYLNQRVSVRAEVEDVLGPRLFKIDERNWADLDPEILVALEAPLAAMVNEDDRVIVTGTMRPFTSVRVEREWGWFEPGTKYETRFRTRNVLVADRITGWDDDNQVFTIRETTVPAPAATGTSGSGAATGSSTSPKPDTTIAGKTKPPLADLAALERAADDGLVGRDVEFSATVARTDKNGGFWTASSDAASLYVLPADPGRKLAAGQSVTVHGHVLRMPEHMEERLEKDTRVGNEEIYVYATRIEGPGSTGK